jgi:hypothetical protein
VPIFRDIGTTSSANKALVLLGVSILTGLLLSSLSTVLFRVIEGYCLVPERVAAWMRVRQQRQQQTLKSRLQHLQQLREDAKPIPIQSGISQPVHTQESSLSDEVTGSDPSQIGIDVRINLVRERLRRYPADERQFGPTQFANALRAIETYGWDRYRLDSQTFWSELISVVPDSLRDEEEGARAPMNFSVSMMYVSGLVGIACLIVGFSISGSWIAPIVAGVALLLLVPLWYKLAVLNTRYLGSVVQAIVNVGRVELAKKMGLSVPLTLQDERDMWEQIFWFVDERFDEKYASYLDSYRVEKEDDDGS